MGPRLNKPLWVALFLGLVAWAYAPILSAGPFGADLELFAGLSGRGSAALYTVPHTDGRPLAALSLFLSRAVWSANRVWPAHLATWLRLENLLVLALAAQGLRIALRRLFTPWFGEETARAAALTAGLLLLVHPLPVAAVAMVHLRGELLALAFGAFGLAAFLEARQENNKRLLGRAFLFAFLAGMCGRWALFLPFLYGVLEVLSSHRHRPTRARWSSALLTFAACGVCVAAEYMLRRQLAPEGARTFQYLSVHLEAIPYSVETLGVLHDCARGFCWRSGDSGVIGHFDPRDSSWVCCGPGSSPPLGSNRRYLGDFLGAFLDLGCGSKGREFGFGGGSGVAWGDPDPVHRLGACGHRNQ